jgi:hypothetical protein
MSLKLNSTFLIGILILIFNSVICDELERRIRNGSVTQRDQFKSTVAILRLGTGDYVCTGTIIDYVYVLTVRFVILNWDFN